MRRKEPLSFWKVYQRISLLGLVIVLMATVTLLGLIATKKILPANTYINSIAVGLLKPQTALVKIEAHLSPIPPATLQVSSPQSTISAHLNELGLYPNTLAVVALSQRPELSSVQRFLYAITSLFITHEYSIRYSFAQDKIETWVSTLADTINSPDLKPSAILGRPGKSETIVIERGEPGVILDQPATTSKVEENFNQGRLTTTAIFFPSREPFTEDEVVESKARVAKFVGKKIQLQNPNVHPSISISDQDIVSLLALPEGLQENEARALIATIAAKINREAVNPIFTFDQTTLKVSEFVPPQTGLSLNETATYNSLVESIIQMEQSVPSDKDAASNPILIDMLMDETKPSVSLESTNDLGIKEKIGFGDSHYDQSIPTRIRNVSLATSRVNNIVVPPGKEFFFNKTLGEVSRSTGFEPAYIIRNGLTELGDGGGVCQVSTTLFRSVLNAGLKVTLRLPHSYRVSYYELDRKPGIDATVYAGNVDFRFINDTPNHILIHGEADPKNLYMHYTIYGTSDGRSTEIKDHITWGYSSPPPTQYIVDQNLPPGSKKQIDWSAAGIKAKFTNVIYDKFGNIIREDTYTSNYKPWSAKYLVGPGTI